MADLVPAATPAQAALLDELAEVVLIHRNRGLDRMSCIVALMMHATMLALIDGISAATFAFSAKGIFEQTAAKIRARVDA